MDIVKRLVALDPECACSWADTGQCHNIGTWVVRGHNTEHRNQTRLVCDGRLERGRALGFLDVDSHCLGCGARTTRGVTALRDLL